MNKWIWKLHSWMGLIAGLGLIVIGLSGSLLVFRSEIDALMHPQLMKVMPQGERLSFDRLLKDIRQQLPDYGIIGWSLPKETWQPDFLWLNRHGSSKWWGSTLNAYTGKILGYSDNEAATVANWLLKLHYTLFLEKWGKVLTGLFAVLLCLQGFSGLWLYRKFWQNFFTLRWSKSARIFFSDAHKMIGISSLVFNLILGFTGAWWNLPTVMTLLSREAEEPVPPPRHFYSQDISLDLLAGETKNHLIGFSNNYINFPAAEGAPLIFFGKSSTRNPFRSDYGDQISFDAKTGEFQEAKPIEKEGWWAQFEDMFAPLHYGSFGGLPIKILWSIGGLCPGVLAISGFLIWKNRTKQLRCLKQKLS